MDYTVHGITQARILEWVVFSFSRGSSQPRVRSQVSHIAGRFFTNWATRKDPGDKKVGRKKQKQDYIFYWNLPQPGLLSGVGGSIRHYWQNKGTALSPLPLFHRHGPGMKELGFVVLTCVFLSSAKLTKENIKVLIVLERSKRRHKAFCSCAQRIIHKVNHWHLFKDFYKRVFQGEHRGRSLRPWEGFLSEAHL